MSADPATPPTRPTRPAPPPREARGRGPRGAADAVYGLGLVGALVFYWQAAHGVGQHLIAVLKSLVWPALLVYDALRSMKG